MAFNSRDWDRDSAHEYRWNDDIEVVDLDDGHEEPQTRQDGPPTGQRKTQLLDVPMNPIPLQRKTSKAMTMTRAMLRENKSPVLYQKPSSMSLPEPGTNFQPPSSHTDTFIEDILKSSKKKKKVQQNNIRATMGFWRLIWFDFKNWYRRRKAKNQEFFLFKNHIKTMESNFGSAIGSLFVFTRWLLVLNFFLALLWLCIVVLPVAFSFDYDRLTRHFAFKNLLDGKGVLSELWVFYGAYERMTGSYHIGLAYLAMMVVTYFGSLFIILGNIIRASEQKTTTTGSRYQFSMMLWTSWDFSITSEEAGTNLTKGIASALKDNLYEAKASQDVKRRSRRETAKVYLMRAGAWMVTILLIGGGCWAIVYLVIIMSAGKGVLPNEGTGEDQDFVSVYGTTIVFSMINAIVPICINQLPKIEQYASGRDELNVTLARVFALRMANLFALIVSLYDTVTGSSAVGCAGTVIGQELYKLVVMDTILHTSLQLSFKFCKYYWTRQKAEFNIPTAILVLIYRQALIWVGTLACPIMPLVGMCSILVFFFLNYTVISHTCKPPIKRWNQSRNTSFFTMFLLASLAMLIPPVSIIIGSNELVNLGQTEITDIFCGPFGNEKLTLAYTRFHQTQPHWLSVTFNNELVNLGQTEIADIFCGPFGNEKPTLAYTRFHQTQPHWLSVTFNNELVNLGQTEITDIFCGPFGNKKPTLAYTRFHQTQPHWLSVTFNNELVNLGQTEITDIFCGPFGNEKLTLAYTRFHQTQPHWLSVTFNNELVNLGQTEIADIFCGPFGNEKPTLAYTRFHQTQPHWLSVTFNNELVNLGQTEIADIFCGPFGNEKPTLAYTRFHQTQPHWLSVTFNNELVNLGQTEIADIFCGPFGNEKPTLAYTRFHQTQPHWLSVTFNNELVNLGQTEIADIFCGPFGNEKPTLAYTRFHQTQPHWLSVTFKYLVSDPVVLPLCFTLISVMVHQRSRIGNEKRRNQMLHAELDTEREENEKLIKRLQRMGVGID